MSEPRMRDDTLEEMAEIALSRSAATRRLCCVVGFTGSDRARIIDTAIPFSDIDARRFRRNERGEIDPEDQGLVLLMHPSPGVGDRLPDGPESDA